MSSPEPIRAAPQEPWSDAVAAMSRTLSWERATRWLTISGGASCGLGIILWLGSWLGIWGTAFAIGWIPVLILAPIVVAVVGFFLPHDPKRLWLELDRRLKLPDDNLARGELGKNANAWVAALQARTDRFWKDPSRLEALRFQQWGRSWGILLVGVAVVLLATSSPPLPGLEAGEETLSVTEDARAHLTQQRETVENWEMPEELRDLEESLAAQWEALMEELESETNPSRAEVLLSFSSLEERLRELSEALAKSTEESNRQPLTSLLEQIPGLEPAAEALRKGDVEGAKQLLEEFIEALKKNPEEMLKNFDPETMERLNELLQQMFPQMPADSALREFLENHGRPLTPEEMEELLKFLEELSKDLDRLKELQEMLKQLQEMQREMGELGQDPDQFAFGGMIPFLMPGLGQMPGMQDGDGGEDAEKGGRKAGEGTEDSFVDPQDRIDQEQGLTAITGQQGVDGDASRFRFSVEEATGQALDAADLDVDEWERLSREAFRDERIPAGHRETIRQYFESIRPRRETP